MKHRILPGLLSTALTLSLCALPASALETEDTACCWKPTMWMRFPRRF